MKSYQVVPIEESGEPLSPIPHHIFAMVDPHPYVIIGADYNGRSPYCLRGRVLTRLKAAQNFLQGERPELRFQIFDAYRPLTVQQFMVNHTFQELKGERELNLLEINQLWEEVYRFWAIPSDNPATPPPHSTGAAIDLTLITLEGTPLAMGGEIDEIGDRSHPDFYENSPNPVEQKYHVNRLLLRAAMESAGFVQHPNEWWHFSYGDQMWAWQNQKAIAHYGRI